MIDRFREFLGEVREGAGDRDATERAQAWLEATQRNIVALTIVFCFVLMTGSCVAVPVIGLLSMGGSEEQRTDSVERKPANPWAIDDGKGSPK